MSTVARILESLDIADPTASRPTPTNDTDE